MKPLIKKLTETFSPSGYENAIREVIIEEIKDFADEVRIDALGNLIARKGSGGKKIMLAAHMDEIGIMVNHVDEKGFARFSSLGGVYPFTLIGSRVRFVNGAAGVIGAHYLKRPIELIKNTEMFIDTGASNPKNSPVRVGDVAGFERPFLDLGNRLVAKSMDDRIGVAVLIETLRKLKKTPHEVYFVFTVQEEVGVRGATTSAYGVNPDLGIAVDVTGADDIPAIDNQKIFLGQGPTFKFKDAGSLGDPRVIELFIKTAQKNKIPFQREVATMGGTDARAIQLTRAGVPVMTLSIPCRYVHSPSETVDYRDVKNAVKLLTKFLEKKVEL